MATANALGTRVLTEWLITALISVVLVLWLSLGQLVERGDNLFYDSVSQWMPVAPNPDIVVVTIDDRSLSELGPWPWPRGHHAELIAQLNLSGAKAIGYDVLFVEPTDDDERLAHAMGAAGNVYLPASIDTPGMNGELSSINLPPEAIARSVAAMGHAVLTPDEDGTVRHLPLWIRADGQKLPHLALELLSHGQSGGPTATLLGHPGEELSLLEPRLIRYASGHAPYTSISFVDVMRGEVPAAFLQDKYVLVGATAQGMGDRYATATSTHESLVPGVYIVAALLQELITDKPIRPVPALTSALLSLIPLALMLVGFLTLRPIANTLLGLGLILLILLSSFVALKYGQWWPPLSACAGIIFAWPLWSWRRLAASYDYVQAELSGLRAEEAARPLAALSPASNWNTGDVISRQVLIFSSALKQFRDFNRYITQSVNSLPDAALMTDLGGVVLIANRRAQKLFPDLNLQGAHLDDLFRRLGLKDWRALIDATSSRDELQLPDGRSLQIAIAALTDSDQQSSGLIVRLADVSRLRAAERERQRTLQLLGHDMRAPQVSILTLLDNDKRPENYEEQIRRNARQTLNLAEGYVQLSRAENQRLSFDIVNLADLVTEAADTLWPQSAAKGVELVIPDDGEEYLIEADAALMRRVIINLLDNAIRHTPNGRYVACKLSYHAGHVLLIVCDQGSGLSDDMQSRLFQPFAGGNVSGSGLGLAFVHAVIQRHGGQISIVPPDGTLPPSSGACFYITLPPAPTDEADA